MAGRNISRYIRYKISRLKKLSFLGDLANDYLESCNDPPLIVADGRSVVIQLLLKKQKSKMHEFRWTEYVQMAKSFVERMKAFNIRLVFYFGADYVFNVLSDDSERQVKTPYITTLVAELFEHIKNGIQPKLTCLPPGVVDFFRYIFQYECGCTVYCIQSEVNREMAIYAARTPGCFGIISGDFCHLIFGKTPLFSVQDFDADTLRTKVYTSEDLCQATGLGYSLLPLLFIMSGDREISYNTLTAFHYDLSPIYGSNDRNLVDLIVKYINEHKTDGISEVAQTMGITSEELFKRICYYRLLGENDRSDDTCEDVNKIKEIYARCEAPLTLYALLKFKKFVQGQTIEDPSENNFPPSAQIYMPIRQRMYHVLFGKESVVIQEWCVRGIQQPEVPDLVRSTPFEIDGDIPSVASILTNQVAVQTRWQLLCACLKLSIPPRVLQQVEPQYVVLCSLLNYLIQCESVELQDYEVRAFINQALLMSANDLDMEERVSCRSVSLAGLFWRGVRLFMSVVVACGCPIPFEETMPWKYFDGRLFYRCYNSLKTGVGDLLNGDEKSISTYQRLYKTAITGTRL